MREGEEKHNRQVVKSDAHKATKLERVASRLTSDRKVEQGTQFSADVLENIFDAVSDWVILTDMKCRILKTNLSGEKFTGLSSEEIIGKCCCELVHGSTKRISGCPLKEAIRTGRRASAELWIPQSQRCLAITIDPIKDDKDKIKSAVHIVRDITQQKKVEESLKGSEEKFRSIFKYANDGIAYLDSFGRILDVNEKVEKIFGGSRSELINKHFTKLGILSIKDIPKYIRMFQDILKGKMANVTVPITNKEGREVFLECSASLIKPDGESARIMVIARDITERRKAEEELRIKDKAISTSINAIAIADLDGNLTYVNNAFIKMWGYNEIGEVLGKTANHFWQTPERLEGRMKAFRHGGGWIDEVPAQRRDGSLFAVQLSTSVILNQLGKPCNIMTSFIDITERKKAEKKLRESEERYKSVFENTFIGLYRTTPDGRILMANPALIQMLGCSSFDELAERNLEEGGFEPYYPRSQFKQLIESGGRIDGFESAWYREDGTVLFVRESARAIRDNDGNILYYEGTVENITERKKAEEALRREHNLLRLLIDNMPDEIYVKDTDSRMLLCNQTVAEHQGFSSPSKLIGKTDFDLYPAEQAEQYRADEQQVMCSGEPKVNYLEICLDKRGGEIWGLNTKIPLRDNDGKIIGIVGIGRDVTQEKKAEEALRKSEENWRSLTENYPDHIMLLDKDANIQFINKTVPDLAKEEVIGKSVFEFTPEAYHHAVAECFNRILASKKSDTYSTAYRAKAGEIRYFNVRVGPVFHDGEVVGFVSHSNDITERKRAEEALSEKHRELQETFQQLEQSRNMLQLVIESIPFRVFWKDRESRYLGCNSLFARDAGLSRPQQLLGKDDFAMGWKEQADIYRADDRQVMETCCPKMNIIEPQTTPAGTTIWLNTSKVPLQKPDGTVFGILGVYEDITERKEAEERLLESEHRLREAQKIAKVGHWSWEVESDTVQWSDELFRITGLDPDVSPPSFAEQPAYFTRESWEKLEHAVQRAVETGIDYDLELDVVRPSGEVRTTHTRGHVIRNQNREAVRLVGTVQDITERKKAEELLRTREKDLAEAQALAHVGNWRWEIIPDEVYWSDEAYRLFGMEPGEAVDYAKYLSIVLPEDRDFIMKEVQDALDGIKPYENEHRIVRNGEIRIHHTKGTVTQDKQGKPMRLFGVVQDITERKKAEEALKESEKRYRATFEQSIDSIVLLDPETGQILAFNDNAYQNLGYSREEFERLNLSDIEIIESPEEIINHMEKITREGIDTFETKQRTKGGRIRNVLVSGKVISISGHDVCQGIWRDITERKQVEESLREYHMQLQSLASQLTLAEERERRRIALALHDQISQPLAISKIKIEELLHSGALGDSHKVLTDVRDWLSKAMMDTRLLTSGLSSPVLYELGFEKAVVAWLDEEIEGKHNIRTELSVDGKLKCLDDDIRALLFRDVRELLINVVKHAQAKKVKVSINKVNNMIQVRVEDDGIGFEPAELSSARESAFGLFSIRERLEHLGGHFEIDSAPGCGCRITMLAPLIREKALDGENK